jgi:hypothetical protein
MKRIVTVVAALGLVVGACGSGDEPSSDETPDAPAEVVDEPSADDSETPQGDGSDPAPDEVDPPDDGMDDADDDGDDNSGGRTIRSINDIPEECREQLASFMREIEPIVSSIDWQTATLADFEAIATDFEAKSEEFDAATVGSGCDDLEFEDEGDFELMIEFARDEAPGVVGFFEFFDDLQSSFGEATGGGDDSASGGIESCADAVDFAQNLMDTYDTFTEVPAADLMEFAGLASFYTTCTPEQLEILQGDEFMAFVGG